VLGLVSDAAVMVGQLLSSSWLSVTSGRCSDGEWMFRKV